MTSNLRRQIAIAIGKKYHGPMSKLKDDTLAELFDREAGAALELVSAKIARLEAALKPFADLAGPLVDNGATVAIGLTEAHFIEARAALEWSDLEDLSRPQ